MIYYLHEKPCNTTQKNAGSKARNDIDSIFEAIGAKKIVFSFKEEEKRTKFDHINFAKQYKKCFLAQMTADDVILLQFPVIAHTIFMKNVISALKKKGIKVILLVHDLEIIRFALQKDVSFVRKVRYQMEELSILKEADKVIVHNSCMKQFLQKKGIKDERMIELDIFDYIIVKEKNNSNVRTKEYVINIAGNLIPKKAGYIYCLPEENVYHLFGAGCSENNLGKNVIYKGSFMPEELVSVLDGDFGLVWDGPLADACEGIYGQYMRYNNPHKTSLYLAAGIPIIIWEKAAMAKFIVDNDCGFAVASLKDISKRLEKLKSEEYEKMKENAKRIGKQLHEGYYTKKAIEKACK